MLRTVAHHGSSQVSRPPRTCHLILLGAFTRAAAAVMVVNFVAALAMVHTRLPFREALDPSAMLASSLFLLFHGAGVPSIDAWRERRSVRQASPRPVESYGR